jgi:hypothetical protein
MAEELIADAPAIGETSIRAQDTKTDETIADIPVIGETSLQAFRAIWKLPGLRKARNHRRLLPGLHGHRQQLGEPPPSLYGCGSYDQSSTGRIRIAV